jgi:small subunit ribosomal protein S16
VAVKIRLKRIGRKKQPSYRIVVMDTRSPRDGKVVDSIGSYTPFVKDKVLTIDMDRYQGWREKGAIPTDAVKRLVRQAGKNGSSASGAETDKKAKAVHAEPAIDVEKVPEPVSELVEEGEIPVEAVQDTEEPAAG